MGTAGGKRRLHGKILADSGVVRRLRCADESGPSRHRRDNQGVPPRRPNGLLVVLCLSEFLSALPPMLHRPVITAGLAACDNPPAGHSGLAHRRCGGPAPYPRALAGLGAAEGWG